MLSGVGIIERLYEKGVHDMQTFDFCCFETQYLLKHIGSDLQKKYYCSYKVKIWNFKQLQPYMFL